MASERQIQANRVNASKSTGPRTPAGKARSSLNAMKTGAFSKLLLLPDEDKGEFDQLSRDLFDEWRPVGRTEVSRVDRLVALLWKQRRTYHGETGLYAMYRQCPEGHGGVATALSKDGIETEAFSRLLRADTAIERNITLVIRALEELQKNRDQRAGLAHPSSASLPSNPTT
jgi:hypothetical protein